MIMGSARGNGGQVRYSGYASSLLVVHVGMLGVHESELGEFVECERGRPITYHGCGFGMGVCGAGGFA